jgi:hypothetical protein
MFLQSAGCSKASQTFRGAALALLPFTFALLHLMMMLRCGVVLSVLQSSKTGHLSADMSVKLAHYAACAGTRCTR